MVTTLQIQAYRCVTTLFLTHRLGSDKLAFIGSVTTLRPLLFVGWQIGP